ncbi:hypothetical protein EVAR_79094_1 [Eumeta japonica]|uniref:Reverse transcriptase domain-containing protein n=1 Tax=Eumeta variegata TaxID=151549 RepID=A0A4C1WZN7_EUMVA|nr:hypothetical protein EVAR_79094_1 [Eumeta japonica]
MRIQSGVVSSKSWCIIEMSKDAYGQGLYDYEKKEVRQGNSRSPKLFAAVLEELFKKLEWDYLELNINRSRLNHLRFADDLSYWRKIQKFWNPRYKLQQTRAERRSNGPSPPPAPSPNSRTVPVKALSLWKFPGARLAVSRAGGRLGGGRLLAHFQNLRSTYCKLFSGVADLVISYPKSLKRRSHRDGNLLTRCDRPRTPSREMLRERGTFGRSAKRRRVQSAGRSQPRAPPKNPRGRRTRRSCLVTRPRQEARRPPRINDRTRRRLHGSSSDLAFVRALINHAPSLFKSALYVCGCGPPRWPERGEAFWITSC